MPDLTSDDFVAYAESRLREAGERYRSSLAQCYDDSRAELAKIASLIWDATIDLLFAVALRDGRSATGVSSDMSNYAKRHLDDAYFYWSGGPARLHNFQHKPDRAQDEFQRYCRYAGGFLDLVNSRLPSGLQLPSSCWDWLAAV